MAFSLHVLVSLTKFLSPYKDTSHWISTWTKAQGCGDVARETAGGGGDCANQGREWADMRGDHTGPVVGGQRGAGAEGPSLRSGLGNGNIVL